MTGPLPDDTWWHDGVVYQIYPRSFADTNGDGVGDLAGIIAHLDHLVGSPGGLGVDAIWLSPIYPSPGLDGGYDVSDHSSVDPLFGTLADFERLVVEAHARGLRVILDLVLNHTSDRHTWFEDSRTSRDNPHADWYIWRDPAGFDRRGRPRPPNNWVSFFGGSAWQWEPARGQFYMHTFLVEQPEVNWRNPDLRRAQFDVVRGWLSRGADGFRLDVFNAFLKAPSFASNPRRWWPARSPWNRQEHLYDKDQPDFPELLDEFRALLDSAPGRMSVGELFASDIGRAVEYSADRHLVFDFGLISTPWSAEAMAREIDRREGAFGPNRWPAVVLSNHDQSRHVSRFVRGLPRRDPDTADRVARAAAVLLLTMRGTPFLYYGEEIGMPDVPIPKSEIVDPPARRASFFFPWWNRDQARTPLPWNATRNGGFTTGRPWLRLSPDAGTRNVAVQAGQPGSVLESYRRLLAVRRASPALRGGAFERLVSGSRDVLAYLRTAGEERAIVGINFGLEPSSLTLPTGSWRRTFDTNGPAAGDGPARADQPETGTIELSGLQAVILTAGGA